MFLKRYLLAAAMVVAGAGFASAATLTGDTVQFDVNTTNGGNVFTDTFMVGAGFDYAIGNHDIDVDFNTGSDDNGFVMTLDNGSYCGFWTCDGTTTDLIFSDLDFSDGESLVGFDLTGHTITPLVTILGPDAIMFSFTDTSYTSDNGLFFTGEFITTSQVPLPAGGLLLLSGLALGGWAARRRKS